MPTTAEDYCARMNRVLDHIDRHLREPLPLERLARVACFSPFHFHRIFLAMTGERPREWVRRRRVERAIVMLSAPPPRRMHEVAAQAGFRSPEEFSRAFKAEVGVPPSRFDPDAHRRHGRERFSDLASPADTRLPPWRPGANPDGFVVELTRRPAHRLAYVRVHDPRQGLEEALDRLMAWAADRGLSDGQLSGESQDDPDLTPLAQVRFDWCLCVPDEVRPDEVVSVRDVPDLTWATVPVYGDIHLEQRAWDHLFGTWLPTSGHEPVHAPAAELYRTSPLAMGWERFDLVCALPVQPLPS